MAIQIEKFTMSLTAAKMPKKRWNGTKEPQHGFILAFAEDHVPSTKAFDPYMHLFLDASNGNVLAFLNCRLSQRWDAMKTRLRGAAHCA
jgi:hypothetical protein